MPGPERSEASWLRALERAMAAQAVWAFRRPWRALAITLVLSAAAWLGSGRLRVEPSMTELLPQSFESVRQTRELGRRLGGIGYVAVVVEGAPVEVLERVADELAPRLEALPSIRYVETGPATRFFEERALYYLSQTDLVDLDAQLQERIDWEKLHGNPLYVDLEGEEPPVVDFQALRAKLGTTSEPARSAYYVDPEALRLVVLAKPNRLASDMRFSRQVVGEVQGVLRGFDAARYAPGLRLTMSGRYKKKVDLQNVVQADLTLASTVSLLLVLGYLLLHFRRPRAIVQLMAPLLLGLLWTYGLAGWLFGTLNILTAFVGVILLGLGIDSGIHFLSRYLDERRAGHPAADAIDTAFGRTGRAALAATLTTVASFASLMVSEFRGFRELGVLAGGGLLLVFLAYALVLPAFEALLPVRVRPGRRVRVPRLVDGLLAGAPWVFWSGMLLAFALVVNAGRVRFDDDFAALEPQQLPAYWLDAEVNRLLGRSQTPLVFLTNDEASARAVSDAVRSRARELGSASGVDRVLSLSDLVPAEQGEAERVLRRMASKLDSIAPESITAELKADFERLREMTRARPFGRSELPPSVRRAFEGEGGALGEFVLVFPGVSMSDGASVRALAAELSRVPAGSGKSMSAAGEAMVLADVLETVFAQTPRIVELALLTVGLVLWLTLGSARLAALAGAPALLSLAMTLGLMPLLGIELNYLNVIILPALIGMGVDGGAHLLVHLEEGKSLRIATWRIGRAVFGSLITTAMGFAALLVARHPGLRSLAQVAVLGLSLNLLVTVVLLPALLALFPSSRRAAGAPPAADLGVGRGEDLPASRPSGVVAQVATCFGAGRARWAPGSLGALLALPAGWLMRELSGTQRLLLIAALTLASTLAVHRYLAGRVRDPQEVVVDEWIGCLITLAFVPFSAAWVVAGYLLFRMFDILKPGPIRWLDRRVHGGVGVMADDVAAGLAAGAVLTLARLAALG